MDTQNHVYINYDWNPVKSGAVARSNVEKKMWDRGVSAYNSKDGHT